MRYLVFGADGREGRAVVEGLLRRGVACDAVAAAARHLRSEAAHALGDLGVAVVRSPRRSSGSSPRGARARPPTSSPRRPPRPGSPRWRFASFDKTPGRHSAVALALYYRVRNAATAASASAKTAAGGRRASKVALNSPGSARKGASV